MDRAVIDQQAIEKIVDEIVHQWVETHPDKRIGVDYTAAEIILKLRNDHALLHRAYADLKTEAMDARHELNELRHKIDLFGIHIPERGDPG